MKNNYYVEYIHIIFYKHKINILTANNILKKLIQPKNKKRTLYKKEKRYLMYYTGPKDNALRL